MKIKKYLLIFIMIFALSIPMMVYADVDEVNAEGNNENTIVENGNNNEMNIEEENNEESITEGDSNENSIIDNSNNTEEVVEPSDEEINGAEQENTEPISQSEIGNNRMLARNNNLLGNSAPKTIYVSSTGSDTTGDGSEDNPYQTLSYAVSQSSKGDTIMLLSDIESTVVSQVWHDLTIDGKGYTVSRGENFETTSDTGRSWYNPAMIEVHPDNGGAILTLIRITLDDLFRHEGTVYKDQDVSPADTSHNLERVQDGIVALYEDPNQTNKAILILDEGATLQNFGGVNAVNLEGNTELIMKNGSVITNNGQNPNNQGIGNGQAVNVLGGTFTMEEGSLITGIVGSNVIFSNGGTAIIGGEISNCNGATPIRSTGITTINLTSTGEIHDLTLTGSSGNYAGMYSYGGATTYIIDGKFYNVTGRSGIWTSNSAAHNVYITENAELYNIPGQVIRTDSGNHFYMSGGSIHDCGIAFYVRKQSQVEITGGTLTNNEYGVLLAQDSTSTAKVFIKGGEITGNDHDFYIQNNNLGYDNGSYMYFDESMLPSSVEMQLDNKTITIPTSNVCMYIGNASNPSKTALNNEADRLGFTNKLTTWWYRNNQNNADFSVVGLTSNGEKLFALYVPVDAAGTPIGDVLCVPIEDGDPINASLSTSNADAIGYSVLLAQANVPVYKITIKYKDKDDSSEIETSYEAEFVKDSNYDVTAFANKTIGGYNLYELPANLTGVANQDIELTTLYARIKDITINALEDTVTYDGEYHELTGFENLTFEEDGETYTVSGLETNTISEKDAGQYVLEITGTPVVTDSNGVDVSDKFNIITNNGSLTINKKTVTITADDLSKVEGEDDPDLTAVIEGLIEGDEVSYTITREEGETEGTYIITVEGEEEQGNYIIEYVPGTFTIEAGAAEEPEEETPEAEPEKDVADDTPTVLPLESSNIPDTGVEIDILELILLLSCTILMNIGLYAIGRKIEEI